MTCQIKKQELMYKFSLVTDELTFLSGSGYKTVGDIMQLVERLFPETDVEFLIMARFDRKKNYEIEKRYEFTK